jgi:hypothetical protein
MTKNKPMTRIDLDYNKNLKYPDINDYLKDTVYASNLTEFPDNQANAAVAFRLIPKTTEWGRKVNIAGFQWQIYLGQFRMYGYNPDLEAVERMRLVIDEFSDGNADEEYAKDIRKRGTPIYYDVVSAADPSTIPIVGVVNYFVDFSPSDLLSIYDYVFGTRWIQASEHYRKTLHNELPLSEEEKQKYINYIKYRIYSLKIPVKLYYYYVNATEPGGLIEFDMSISALIPTYKSKVDFLSKSLQLNPKAVPTDYDYFNVAYTSTNIGKMRLKGFFSDSPTDFEEEPSFKDVGTTNVSYASSLMASRLLFRQSRGYDIERPTVVYTYDFLAGTDNYPVLNDEEFDRFTPDVYARVVDAIKIESYRIGNKLKEPTRSNTESFYMSLVFSTINKELHTLSPKLKFQIKLKSGKIGNDSVPETSPINANYATVATLIAGDFQSDKNLRKVTRTDNLTRGTVNVFRANTVLTGSLGHRMFTQRTNTDDYAELEQPALSEFQAEIQRLSTTSEKTTYELTVTWPAGINLRAFYNFLKCRWITLSIGNVFHEIFAEGTIEKSAWNVYADNSSNQLSNLALKRYPTCQIAGLYVPETRLKNSTSSPEISRINDIGNGGLVLVDNDTMLFSYVSTDFKDGYRDLYITPQMYIASSGVESSVLFIKESYILVAYRPKRSNIAEFTYILNPPKPDPVKKFNYSNYLTYLKYSQDSNIVTWRLSHSDFLSAAKAALGLNPAAGDYMVYIITKLSATPYSTANRVFSVSSKASNKFKSDLVIKYTWRKE